MDYDMLLFPVHKPQHWYLEVIVSVLYYFLPADKQSLFAGCLSSVTRNSLLENDSLNCSNEDAVNWIW